MKARQSAASTYLPIVAALNMIYLVIFVVYKRSSLTTFQCIMATFLVALSYLSYRGIVNNHGHAHQIKSDALVGGAFLDMLGLVVAVQFGSVLFSDQFYWLLLLIPTVSGWKFYTTVKSAMPNARSIDAAPYDNGAASEKANEKRQKRAERRRQKW
jgi:hypothetical protein